MNVGFVPTDAYCFFLCQSLTHPLKIIVLRRIFRWNFIILSSGFDACCYFFMFLILYNTQYYFLKGFLKASLYVFSMNIL